MTARLAVIVVPVGAMECITCTGEKGTPRHAGQTIDMLIFHRVALIRHVDGRPFMICTELAFGSVSTAHTTCTTLRKDQLLPLEGSDQLRCKIHNNLFLVIRYVRRERSQLLVGHQAHIMGGD